MRNDSGTFVIVRAKRREVANLPVPPTPPLSLSYQGNRGEFKRRLVHRSLHAASFLPPQTTENKKDGAVMSSRYSLVVSERESVLRHEERGEPTRPLASNGSGGPPSHPQQDEGAERKKQEDERTNE